LADAKEQETYFKQVVKYLEDKLAFIDIVLPTIDMNIPEEADFKKGADKQATELWKLVTSLNEQIATIQTTVEDYEFEKLKLDNKYAAEDEKAAKEDKKRSEDQFKEMKADYDALKKEFDALKDPKGADKSAADSLQKEFEAREKEYKAAES